MASERLLGGGLDLGQDVIGPTLRKQKRIKPAPPRMRRQGLHCVARNTPLMDGLRRSLKQAEPCGKAKAAKEKMHAAARGGRAKRKTG